MTHFAFWLLYMVGAWVSTGVYYSRHVFQCRAMEPVSDAARICWKYAEMDSAFVGFIWPLYWFYRSAFQVFTVGF